MKQGLTYIADRTGQFRYSTAGENPTYSTQSINDPEEQWLQPLSIYYAHEAIRRGQPVSIVLASDLSQEEIGNANAYVELTNTSKHKKCIGLALEYAAKGQPLHIQSIGKFTFNSTSLASNNLATGQTEYYPNFGYKLTETDTNKSSSIYQMYAGLIGKPVYVASRLIDSKNPFYVSDDNTENANNTTEGILTVDEKETYYGDHNIIQVGFVTDAPHNSGETDLCIELQLEGDGRGPIDNTQSELKAGEPLTISSTNQARVLAIGEEDNSPFKCVVSYCPTQTASKQTLSSNDFIAIQRMDGKSGFIVFDSSIKTFDQLYGAVIASGTAEDKAFMNVTKYYALAYNYNYGTESSIGPTLLINSSLDPDTASLNTTLTSLNIGLQACLNFSSDNNTITSNYFENIASIPSNSQFINLNLYNASDSTAEGSIIINKLKDSPYSAYEYLKSSQNGGYYDLYISSSLYERYFNGTKTLSKGSLYNKGKAVLADIRISSRQNIAGLYFNNTYNQTLPINSDVIALHTGLFTIDTSFDSDSTYAATKFNPGATYYLGSHGELSTAPVDFTDSVVKIGVAQSATQLLVDCDDCRQYDTGTLPVGYIKPTIKGNLEYGFLLMDGGETAIDDKITTISNSDGSSTVTTVSTKVTNPSNTSENVLQTRYEASKYPVLYERLQSWYQSDALDYREETLYTYTTVVTTVATDGTKTSADPTTSTEIKYNTFIIPKVIYTPANNSENNSKFSQIKWLEDGIYNQIPRIPYIRNHGTFTKDQNIKVSVGKIDISKLVHYGPIENSVYDVNLEDFDIHLYVNLNSGKYKNKDQYKDYNGLPDWVEVPQGFNLFNNTTYFGYRWKITTSPYTELQDNTNKAIVDGITDYPLLKYYLETDLGETSTPYTVDNSNISLGIAYQHNPFSPPEICFGLNYKVYISRHEYSTKNCDIEALFNNSISQNFMDAVTREPTTNPISAKAVYDFYNDSAKSTDSYTIKDTLTVGNNGSGSVNFSLGNTNTISGTVTFKDNTNESNPSLIVKGADVRVSVISTTTPDNTQIVPYATVKSYTDSCITSLKTGLTGTSTTLSTNALKLKGYLLGSGINATLSADKGDSEKGWIPYVDSNSSLTLGSSIKYEISSGNTANSTYSYLSGNLIDTISYSADSKNKYKIVYNINSTETDPADVALIKTSNNTDSFASVKVGNVVLASSITYKNLYNTDILNTDLSAKINNKDYSFDQPNFTSIKIKKNDSDDKNLTSALQAAYELPLGLFSYKQDQDWMKRYLGIVIEEVNAMKDRINKTTIPVTRTLISDDSYIPSSASKFVKATEPFTQGTLYYEDNKGETLIDSSGFTSDTDVSSYYVEVCPNKFTYTETQRKNIDAFFTLLTDNTEKGQNIISSIGMLLAAAKESQKRLLNLEASTFGRDAETIPGDITTIKHSIETALPDTNISQTPTYIGLNRIVRALCKEVFDDYDPMTAAELSPVQGSYRARLTDLYTQVEGENGGHVNLDNYKKGAVLNPLDGTNAWYKTTDYYSTDSQNDNESNAEAAAQQNTYPTDIKLSENTDGDLTAEEIDDQSKFNGLNDAVNRIVQKLNVLTAEVNGKDNINNGAVRLNIIRENIKLALNEMFFASYDDPAEYNSNTPFANSTTKVSRLDKLDQLLYGHAYSKELSNYNGTIGVVPATIDNYDTYSNIVDILAETVGQDILPLKNDGQQLTLTDITQKRMYESISTRLVKLENAVDYAIESLTGTTVTYNYSNITSKSPTRYDISEFISKISTFLGLTYDTSSKTWSYGSPSKVTSNEVTGAYNIILDVWNRLNKVENTNAAVIKSLGDYYNNQEIIDSKSKNTRNIYTDVADLLKTIYGSTSGRTTSGYLNQSNNDIDEPHRKNVINMILETLYATKPKNTNNEGINPISTVHESVDITTIGDTTYSYYLYTPTFTSSEKTYRYKISTDADADSKYSIVSSLEEYDNSTSKWGTSTANISDKIVTTDISEVLITGFNNIYVKK